MKILNINKYQKGTKFFISKISKKVSYNWSAINITLLTNLSGLKKNKISFWLSLLFWDSVCLTRYPLFETVKVSSSTTRWGAVRTRETDGTS